MLGMQGVGLIGAVIIGIVAGWIAERVNRANHRLLTNLFVGIVGALIGSLIAGLGGYDGARGFWANLVVATIGAIIFLWVLRLINGRQSRGA